MSSSTSTDTTITRPPEDLVPAPVQAQDELVASDTDKSSVSPGVQSVKGDDEVLIVDWDGLNDPENPKNWPSRRKWTAAGVVAAFTSISPVTSSISAPAGAAIARDFGIHNESLVAMTVSIFVLAYAFGPLILAPLCEVFGRSRVMMASNAVFLAWNLGCGFAQNAGQLLGFRFIAGLGGSAPLAIGGAVLSDCFRPEERGRAISLFSLAPILGPTLGPVAGAWIVERTTWRWVYWGTSIIDAVIISVAFLIFEETKSARFFGWPPYPPVLLKRKAKRIERSVDAEKGPLRAVRTPFQTQDRSVRKLLSTSLLRPFRFFVTESIVQLLGLYMAFLYAVIYLTFTTLPGIYQKTYHESLGISGLHYIALGVGIMITAQVTARALDWSLVYYTKKNGGSMQPEYRLPCSIPGTIAMPIGLLLLGWGAQKHVYWIVPDIGLAFIGCGMVSNSISIQAYIVDTYKLYAASALAAVSCLRCLFAFTFPLFAPYMYNALGYGKGNTILAVVAIVLGCPAPWFFMKYGRRIRARSKFTPTMLEGRS